MKRMMMVWVMILCLVPLGAWAENPVLTQPPGSSESEDLTEISLVGNWVIESIAVGNMGPVPIDWFSPVPGESYAFSVEFDADGLCVLTAANGDAVTTRECPYSHDEQTIDDNGVIHAFRIENGKLIIEGSLTGIGYADSGYEIFVRSVSDQLIMDGTAVTTSVLVASENDNSISGVETHAESSYFGQQTGDFWYRLDRDGNAVITRYEGQAAELVIPSELDGHPVTRIGGAAFHGHHELTHVSLPEGITEIEAQAFDFCDHMAGVSLPDSLTAIGDYAFSHSGLTGITIPNHVTSIGESAFGCTLLTSVFIPKSVVTVKGNPFSSCTELAVIEASQDSVSLEVIDGVLFSVEEARLVCYPSASDRTEYTVPEQTRVIGEFAFSYADKLTAVMVPEGVTGIGRSSFHYCPSLTFIMLPASLTEIGSSMLDGCPSAVVITPFISEAHTYCHDHNLRCLTVRTLAADQMRLDHSQAGIIDIPSVFSAIETDLDAARIGMAIIDELHEQNRFQDINLRMIKHIPEKDLWVFVYWADSTGLGYTLNIAVNEHDGRIVSAWADD